MSKSNNTNQVVNYDSDRDTVNEGSVWCARCEGMWYSRAGSNLGLDDIDDSRFSERREVAELVALASDDLAHDTAHDLWGWFSKRHSLYTEVGLRTLPDRVFGRSATM